MVYCTRGGRGTLNTACRLCSSDTPLPPPILLLIKYTATRPDRRWNGRDSTQQRHAPRHGSPTSIVSYKTCPEWTYAQSC